MPESVVERIGIELEGLLKPLADAAEDDEARRRLFAAVVPELDDADDSPLTSQDVQDALDAFEAAYNILGDIDSEPASLEEFGERLDAFQSLVTAIHDLENAFDDPAFDDLAQALVEFLVLDYFKRQYPTALDVGMLLTIVQPTQFDADSLPKNWAAGSFQYNQSRNAELHLEQVSKLLEDPVGELQSVYLNEPIDTDEVARIETRIFPWVTMLAGHLGFRLSYGMMLPEEDNFSDIQGFTLASRMISVSRSVGDDARLKLSLGLGLTDGHLSLMGNAYGGASVPSIDVGDWTIEVEVTADGVVALHTDGIDSADGSASAEASVSVTNRGGDEAAVRIGGSDSTRLELGTVSLDGTLRATEDAIDVDASISGSDSSIVVSPGDGDSFLQKVLPDDGIGVDFDAGIGWVTERGIYFEGGGAGLATDIPVNFDIANVVSVETLQLAAEPDPSGESMSIPVQIAADPQVSLGPIDAAVRGIGLEADVAFPENNDGNLGPLDVELKFKPPSGAGLSVDAGVVAGGGYLEFDHENERYAGVLQLKIGEMSLTAIGLLTTELPGGRDGFSLLLIIAGEFSAFQLGFGFKLEGMGGLMGVNRSMDVPYLIAGVNDGTVRSIMFPDDPVRNAPQIVSNVRNGFPVAAGNHVFGPMGKLSWGTPTMMSASVGILFELPDPFRIAILGRVYVGLPQEDVGILELNMDVMGAVDFGEQVAAAAATLYDSRVLTFTLTGDMAMKTGWGGDPTFVLSVGGFNPRFEPPADFPELRRIALSLGPGNPEIRWEGYFAVTSNTVQVGARVELYAAAAGFSFEGKYGFDTLFRFQPFELIADFYAGFSLKRGGSTLMSVDLDGTLKGPGPWHASGKASFEIWPVEFSVSFDAEFGQSKSAGELSPADVYGQVVAALGDRRNWSAQRPEGGEPIVTLRHVEPEGDQVLAHPYGHLSVRQQIAPLGVRIETFGNGEPAGYDRFDVTTVTVGGVDEGGDPTREQFAPSEYFDLSDAEKLDGPEFESYEAGRHVANTRLAYGGSDDAGLLATDSLDYETAVIDEQASFDPVAIGRIGMPQSTAAAVSAVSAVAHGPLRTTGEERYEVTDDETGPTGVESSVSVSDAQFVVARTADMTRVGLDAVPADGTTKREAQEALSAHLDATGGDPDDYQVVGTHVVADDGGDT